MFSQWRSLRLGNHALKIGSGATPRGGESVYQSEGISLIRSQNVYNNYFDFGGLTFLDPIEAEKLNNVTVKSGDILLNITGDLVARVCTVPDKTLPARVNQHVAIIRPDPQVWEANFVRYYLVSTYMQEYMLSLADAGATRKALTKGMIENFIIPAPSLFEQHAIADILGSLDDKIELNRRMNATLEESARALFKSWFVDFDPVSAKMEGREPVGMDAETAALFPDRLVESALGLIPEGWDVGQLDDMLVLQRGFDLPTPQRILGQYPIIAASGPAGTHNEYKVPGPGVTTGRSGVLGRVFFVHENYWPLNTSLWVKEFKASRPIYAYQLLCTIDLGMFNAGSAVPTLNRNHIHGLPVILPPLSIIERFEQIVMPLFQRNRKNEQDTLVLAEIRDALLPKLLSGEVRVSGLTLENV